MHARVLLDEDEDYLILEDGHPAELRGRQLQNGSQWYSGSLFRTCHGERPRSNVSVLVPSGLCSLSIFFLLFYSTSSAYPRHGWKLERRIRKDQESLTGFGRKKLNRKERKDTRQIRKKPKRREKTNPVIGVSVKNGSGDVARRKVLQSIARETNVSHPSARNTIWKT